MCAQLTTLLCPQFLAIGLAGGTAVGVGNYCVEHAGFALCHMLERRGTVSRLSKAKCPELKAHPSSNVWTVGTPYIPLYWLLARNWGGLHGFGNKMQVSFDVSYIFVFMWYVLPTACSYHARGSCVPETPFRNLSCESLGLHAHMPASQ